MIGEVGHVEGELHLRGEIDVAGLNIIRQLYRTRGSLSDFFLGIYDLLL